MKINQEADLTILLQRGWYNDYSDCYYKVFENVGSAEISLVINPVGVNLGFVISSIYYESDEQYDESIINMFQILEEVDFLKKLNILIK